MKLLHSSLKLQNVKNAIYNAQHKIFLTILILLSLVAFPLCLEYSCLPLQRSSMISNSFGNKEIEEKQCSIFSGKWIPYLKGPYYTNLSCNLIDDEQNCVKLGRNDTDFMKWRWKPNECELPMFDAIRFLEIVTNKSMVFVGDSVGRNQMESLLCLLSSTTYPEDLSRNYSSDVKHFRRYYYVDYNFTVVTLWSPFLVKSNNVDSTGLVSLNLDEPDEVWSTQIEKFDYLIISGGQWFFLPLVYYENGKGVKCHMCNINNITSVPGFYGYKMAFRTAFRKILDTKNYKGETFLRTFSPSHFENGMWNSGGSCARTRPYTNKEMKYDGFNMDMNEIQVEEFRVAEEEGRIKGMKFHLLNTTEVMLMRPDGHPNHHKLSSSADCVHWCLPGAIDVLNEFLMYILNKEKIN
ncbi:hypothetical protein ACFE04_010515 [Oxalis oulophora]